MYGVADPGWGNTLVFRDIKMTNLHMAASESWITSKRNILDDITYPKGCGYTLGSRHRIPHSTLENPVPTVSLKLTLILTVTLMPLTLVTLTVTDEQKLNLFFNE